MTLDSSPSNHPSTNLDAARHAIAQGNLPLAIALLTSYLTEQDASDDTGLFTAHSLRAQLLLATSDTMAATDDIVWLQRLAPDAKESLLLAAQYEKQRGNKNESLRLFSRLFELYPELMTQVSGNF